ncbi:MAG TPA: DUF4254 domain-containing protein [Chitinophagaceae bacterium]|nr:DUF4254 domain-containing protein [Chitinophagaceae bacterium]
MDVNAAINIFYGCVAAYHESGALDGLPSNPHAEGSVEHLLYEKCWTDNIQWHLEDAIRDPAIDPVRALELKRKIDRHNQRRTDIVERIDEWFFETFRSVKPVPEASLNTETPGWALDRLSILTLKIWHMQIEAQREDAGAEHRERCREKWRILREQEQDLADSIRQLLDEMASGKKRMKLYRQFKMYNDESLNPVLYRQTKD